MPRTKKGRCIIFDPDPCSRARFTRRLPPNRPLRRWSSPSFRRPDS
jgi:hypothetical protein